MGWGNSLSQCDSTPMHWKPRLKEYSNATKLNRFEHTALKAWSFGHVYLMRFGKRLVLNTAAYYAHTQDLQGICKALRIKITHKINCPKECSFLEYQTKALPILYTDLARMESMVKHGYLRRDVERARDYWRSNVKDLKKEIKAHRKAGAVISKAQIKRIQKMELNKVLSENAAKAEARSNAAKLAAEARRVVRTSWFDQRPNQSEEIKNDHLNGK